MEEIISLSCKNQERAWEIIRDTDIINIWKSVNAEINLVGSLKTGLLMKHRDIDFHIYSSPLKIQDSFCAISKLAENHSIKSISYSNLIDTEEECIEWHAWYEDADKELWQIDMIHIVKGSAYDGYVEKVTEQVSASLTEESRNIILKLKFDTPDDMKIMGIEYYKAVICDGIRDYNEFINWRKANPVNGIMEFNCKIGM